MKDRDGEHSDKYIDNYYPFAGLTRDERPTWYNNMDCEGRVRYARSVRDSMLKERNNRRRAKKAEADMVKYAAARANNIERNTPRGKLKQKLKDISELRETEQEYLALAAEYTAEIAELEAELEDR